VIVFAKPNEDDDARNAKRRWQHSRCKKKKIVPAMPKEDDSACDAKRR
jgi:hypothetical protein